MATGFKLSFIHSFAKYEGPVFLAVQLLSRVRLLHGLQHTRPPCPSLSPGVCSNSCPLIQCPPGSSVHGILQARILEWVAILFSSGSSWPRDQTRVSCIAGEFFTIWATREAHQELPDAKPQTGPSASSAPHFRLEAGRSFRLFSYQPSYSPAPLPPGSFLWIKQEILEASIIPPVSASPFPSRVCFCFSPPTNVIFFHTFKKKNHTIKEEYSFLVKAF